MRLKLEDIFAGWTSRLCSHLDGLINAFTFIIAQQIYCLLLVGEIRHLSNDLILRA